MKKLLPTLLGILLNTILFAQLTIQITQTPNNTPANSTLYFAGNVNNWSEGDPDYAFEKNNSGIEALTLDIDAGTVEFKITRGSWTSVEGNANGQYRPNRSYDYNGQVDTLFITVLTWEDLAGGTGNSTAADNVTILSENFDLPTLGRERRVWIYLPPDYKQSNNSYPVLYMHDGQNLFDASTSFSGEWQVDETLNELFVQGDPGIIVVGIDNGGAERIEEYTPWPHPQYGGGGGAMYITSIIQDLKPYIDANYRTLSDPENTGIMGSSLGGLISLYGLIEHQEVFGKAGVFSPSYWFNETCFDHVLSTGKEQPVRIYTIGGEQEGGNMAVNIQRMDSIFQVTGFSATEYQSILHPDGQHNEAYWAREFGEAYLWLFRNETTSTVASPSPSFTFSIYPNPAKDSFWIHLSQLPPAAQVRIVDLSGKIWSKQKLSASTQVFHVDQLPAGLYRVQIYSGEQRLGNGGILID